MLTRIAVPCALLLGLMACTSQTMADGSTRLSISPANLFAQPGGGYGQAGVQPAPAGYAGAPPVSAGAPPVDGVLVRRVAARFVADWREGGMAGVTTDISNCYARAERGGPDRTALRDCIALDMAGKNREQANEQRFGRPTTDYLSDDAVLARLNRYAPQVFHGEAETVAFMRDTGHAVYYRGAAMLRES